MVLDPPNWKDPELGAVGPPVPRGGRLAAGPGILTPAPAMPGAVPRKGGALLLELFEAPNAKAVFEEDCPAAPKLNVPLLLLVEVLLMPVLLDPNANAPAEAEAPLPVASRAGGKDAPLVRPKLWFELSPEA